MENNEEVEVLETEETEELQELENQLGGMVVGDDALNDSESEEIEEEVDEPVKEVSEEKPVQTDEMSNEDQARLRIQLKEEREKNAKIAARLEEIETERSSTSQVNPVSNGEIFNGLHMALTGSVDNAAEVEKAARTLIDSMSSADIAEVVRDARNGKFGDVSYEIEQMAINELPIANTRETLTQRQQQEQQARQVEMAKEVESSMTSVLREHGLLIEKDDSVLIDPDFEKFIPEFREEFIGKVDEQGKVIEPGPLHHLFANPDWPKKLVPLMKEIFDHRRTKVVTAAARSKQEKLESNRQSLSSSGSYSGNKAGGELEMLHQQLVDAGTVG